MNDIADNDIVRRVDDLEEKEKKLEEDLRPLLNLYYASAILGKILVICGGVAVGVATIWGMLLGPFHSK